METRRAGERSTDGRATERNGSVERRILERVARAVGDEQYERFIAGQTSLSYEEGRLDVAVPDRFMRDLIDRRFGSKLREAAESEQPAGGVEVRFRVDDTTFAGRRAHGRAEPPPPTARRAPRRPRRHRLDDFVVGESNRLAFASAERIAAADGPDAFSPLFIHGVCGVGKTHLLQGIAERHRELFGDAKVRYTTAESFTNAFLHALQTRSVDAFRREHRGLDVLCIDDVHFFGSKTQTQSELLHTAEAASLAGTRLVLASDEHPRRIAHLSHQLASRFSAGAVVRLDAPDSDLRRALVRRFAERRGIVFEDAAVELVAERSLRAGDTSVRTIEGLVIQVEAVCRLLPELAGPGGRAGLNVVGRALGLGEQRAEGGVTRPVGLDLIVSEVCRALNVELDELLGRGRHKRVVLAREMVTLLARRMTTSSFPEIARALGRPSHSTVVTAHNRVRRSVERGARVEAGSGFDGATYGELADRLGGDVKRGARSW